MIDKMDKLSIVVGIIIVFLFFMYLFGVPMFLVWQSGGIPVGTELWVDFEDHLWESDFTEYYFGVPWLTADGCNDNPNVTGVTGDYYKVKDTGGSYQYAYFWLGQYGVVAKVNMLVTGGGCWNPDVGWGAVRIQKEDYSNIVSFYHSYGGYYHHNHNYGVYDDDGNVIYSVGLYESHQWSTFWVNLTLYEYNTTAEVEVNRLGYTGPGDITHKWYTVEDFGFPYCVYIVHDNTYNDYTAYTLVSEFGITVGSELPVCEACIDDSNSYFADTYVDNGELQTIADVLFCNNGEAGGVPEVINSKLFAYSQVGEWELLATSSSNPVTPGDCANIKFYEDDIPVGLIAHDGDNFCVKTWCDVNEQEPNFEDGCGVYKWHISFEEDGDGDGDGDGYEFDYWDWIWDWLMEEDFWLPNYLWIIIVLIALSTIAVIASRTGKKQKQK